tara:strand:- start:197 stop:649 length:453 start_codon:yes stop_codon:yes gene_type:complete
MYEEKIIKYFNQTREVYGDEINVNQTIISKSKNSNKEKYSSDLNKFYKQINKCQKCSLSNSRTNFVFGVGDENASLMLVGEAPGENEDIKGEPFVGRAGILLDKILLAIDRTRDRDVYICNVLKCRPPKNRDPLAEEVHKCEPYLFIKLI